MLKDEKVVFFSVSGKVYEINCVRLFKGMFLCYECSVVLVNFFSGFKDCGDLLNVFYVLF